MSYIPNSAIPHAQPYAQPTTEPSRLDWQRVTTEARDLADRAVELVRERPREAAAGAVALLAALGFALWRATRDKRTFRFG